MAITKIQSESLNLADTYDFTGTVTGAGESNAPYFRSGLASLQQIGTGGSYTKLNLSNEVFDSANAYDTSTYRWTPQTAGKYFVYGCATMYQGASTMRWGDTLLAKNQVGFARAGNDYSNNYGYSIKPTVCGIIDLNGSTDYVELYARGYSGGTNVEVEPGNDKTYFGGYLISTT